jgi:hypothetical protein
LHCLYAYRRTGVSIGDVGTIPSPPPAVFRLGRAHHQNRPYWMLYKQKNVMLLLALITGGRDGVLAMRGRGRGEYAGHFLSTFK